MQLARLEFWLKLKDLSKILSIRLKNKNFQNFFLIFHLVYIYPKLLFITSLTTTTSRSSGHPFTIVLQAVPLVTLGSAWSRGLERVRRYITYLNLIELRYPVFVGHPKLAVGLRILSKVLSILNGQFIPCGITIRPCAVPFNIYIIFLLTIL